MNRSGLFLDKKMRKTVIPGGWPGSRVVGWTLAWLVMSASAVFAEEAPPAVNAGDTAWLLVSTALVMIMTPGLALFYGGMVRRKNVLATIMHSFIAFGVISIQWVLFGYSLSFGPDVGHVI